MTKAKRDNIEKIISLKNEKIKKLLNYKISKIEPVLSTYDDNLINLFDIDNGDSNSGCPAKLYIF